MQSWPSLFTLLCCFCVAGPLAKPCVHQSLCLCCLAPTPINVEELETALEGYPNREAAEILLRGFTEGFQLGFSGERVAMEAHNLRSARDFPAVLSKKLEKELQLGRIVGPFQDPPLHNLRVSPLGLVPKSTPGKFRLIHHLSWPDQSSVNEGIDPSLCKVKYTSFDEAVNRIAGLGSGCLMAKSDIESAFRLLPICPEDFSLLGMKDMESYFVGKCLPMGAASAPALFETFSTFIEWIARERAGCDRILHYCDDFFIYGNSGRGKDSCEYVLRSFVSTCNMLGVPLSPEKTVGPAPKIMFLGLEIDAVQQLVCIPHEKLVALQDKLATACSSKKITLRRLQSLIGSLSFVCKAVPPGRAFLRRLINLTCGVRKPWHTIRLTVGAREDLEMWKKFLVNCNGSSIIPDQFWTLDCDIQLFTDASGTEGFGGFFRGEWFQGRWPEDIIRRSLSIAWMEFFPVVVATAVWGHKLEGKRVIFRSDNESVVAIINKQSFPCPDIMHLVRIFVLQCLKYNLHFKSNHIPGIDNEISDALSRFQMIRFRRLVPTAAPEAVRIPEELWRILRKKP